MFLKADGGYRAGGTQYARGPFIVICDDPKSDALRPELRAIVRGVKLEQCGHWMMGRTKIQGIEIVLSGAYGGDGLPIHLQHKSIDDADLDRVWASLHPIPEDLQEAFWKGGGHNSAGAEGPVIREWGLKNLTVLSKEQR